MFESLQASGLFTPQPYVSQFSGRLRIGSSALGSIQPRIFSAGLGGGGFQGLFFRCQEAEWLDNYFKYLSLVVGIEPGATLAGQVLYCLAMAAVLSSYFCLVCCVLSCCGSPLVTPPLLLLLCCLSCFCFHFPSLDSTTEDR